MLKLKLQKPSIDLKIESLKRKEEKMRGLLSVLRLLNAVAGLISLIFMIATLLLRLFGFIDPETAGEWFTNAMVVYVFTFTIYNLYFKGK